MRWVCGDGACPACHPETFERWLMVTYGALQCEGTKLHQVPIDHAIERRMYAERDAHLTQIAAEQAKRSAEWYGETVTGRWSSRANFDAWPSRVVAKSLSYARLYGYSETCHNGEGEDVVQRHCGFEYCTVCNNIREKLEREAKGSESMLGDKTSRIANARRLLDRGRVNVAVADSLWVVQGDTGNYIVKKKNFGPFIAECQCEDFKFNTADHNGYCKHIMAVALSESYHTSNSLESLSSAKGAKLSIGVYVRPTGSVLHQTFELEKTSTLASNAVYVDVELTNGISKRIKIKVNGEGKITVEPEKFI